MTDLFRTGDSNGNSRTVADGRPLAKRVSASGELTPRRRDLAGAHGRLTDQRDGLRADAVGAPAHLLIAVKSRRPVQTFRVSGSVALCGRFLPHSDGLVPSAFYSSQNTLSRQADVFGFVHLVLPSDVAIERQEGGHCLGRKGTETFCLQVAA